MRQLSDQNLSHKLPGLCVDLFPGSTQVRLLDLGRATDRNIWDVAKADGYMIVSLMPISLSCRNSTVRLHR